MPDVGYERSEITAPHIGLHHNAPLAVLAADLVRSFLEPDVRNGAQRHELDARATEFTDRVVAMPRDWDRQHLERGYIAPRLFRQADPDWKSPVTHEESTGL